MTTNANVRGFSRPSLYAEKDGDEFPEATNPTRAAELKAEFAAELAQTKGA